jgi:biotin synthase
MSNVMTRTHWTDDEIADLFDLPFTELAFRAAQVQRVHRAEEPMREKAA